MMQPCHYNLINKPCGQVAHGAPVYVENVGPQVRYAFDMHTVGVALRAWQLISMLVLSFWQ